MSFDSAQLTHLGSLYVADVALRPSLIGR